MNTSIYPIALRASPATVPGLTHLSWTRSHPSLPGEVTHKLQLFKRPEPRNSNFSKAQNPETPFVNPL